MPDKADGSSFNKIDLCLVIGVAAWLYLLLFKLPFYPFYSESDHLIFLYNADRMLAGEAMYRDFFQFTFPGGQVLYYILFSIFGIHFWVLPLAIVAMGTASFYCLLRVSKEAIDGPLAYLPPVIFVLFGMRWFGLDGSHRMFSPLLVLAAICLLLRGRSVLNLAAAGSMCGLASYFTQQRGLVAVISIGAFLLIEGYFTARGWTPTIERLAVLGTSFLITLFLSCLPFIVSAGWETFYWSTIEYPAFYYRYHEHNSVSGIGAGFRELLLYPGAGKYPAIASAIAYNAAVPLAPVCFFILFAVRRRRYDWEYWQVPLLLAVVGAFGVLGTPNPGHLRYFQIAGPSLVLTFWMIRYFGFLNVIERNAVFLTSVLFLLIGVLQVIRIQTSDSYVRIDAPRGTVYIPANEQSGRLIWIAEHTSPDDAVFETTNPYVYFLFGLRNPSRYTQIYPTDYTRPEFVAGVVQDLSKDRPKYILWPNNYNKLDSDRTQGDHTAPLAGFVQRYYTPVGPVYTLDNQPIQVWEFKGPQHFPK